MSILIKDMEMPEKCTCCPLVHYYENLETGNLDVWCKNTHRLLAFDWEGSYIDRPDWCSISNVPTPHGRLIDADDLYDETERGRLANPHTGKAAQRHNAEYIHFLTAISVAPTIIEAEE